MPRLELVSVEIHGTAALQSQLRSLGLVAPQALATGLYQEAEATMTDAKVLTPIDTGNLRNSGHVQTPVIDGPIVSVALGFGGPAGSGNHAGQTNTEDVGYAVYVHERVGVHHPVGQAKFLESAIQRRASGVASRLATSLRRSWERIVRHGTA